MPAKTKADLMGAATKEFATLARLIAQTPAALALEKDADDTSIRDILVHRAHWIDLFLGWYRGGRAGEEVHFPAKGYNWAQLPAYNAALRNANASVSWDDAVSRLEDAHAVLIGFLEDRNEQELYGGPMKGGKNAWTTGRWAEAAGPSHYRSASKYIRARLKAARK